MTKVLSTLLYVLLKALALLPLRALYVLSDLTFPLLYHIVRYRRHLVRRNLSRAYPDKDTREIRRLERGFYRHFCNYVVETVKLLHISDDEMRRRLVFRDMDLIEDMRRDGKPIFVFLGHYGNWEYVTSISLWCQPGLAPCQVYHPLSNKAMDALMLRLRARFHSVGIAQKQTFRDLLRMKNEGQQPLLGLIADQRPPKRHHDVWTTFLRQPTAIITGSERIGQRMDAHFVYADIEVLARGRYRLTIKPIVPDDPDEPFAVSRQYMRMLEESIDRAPQYYLWSHNRWKWSPADIASMNL